MKDVTMLLGQPLAYDEWIRIYREKKLEKDNINHAKKIQFHFRYINDLSLNNPIIHYFISAIFPKRTPNQTREHNKGQYFQFETSVFHTRFTRLH